MTKAEKLAKIVFYKAPHHPDCRYVDSKTRCTCWKAEYRKVWESDDESA